MPYSVKVPLIGAVCAALTMRLSDAGLRRVQTKPLYLNHRLPPWLTEDATPAIARTVS